MQRKTFLKMGVASRLTAPEIAFIAVLAVVAIFQVMLCITALAFIGPKGDAAGIMLLRGIMAIGVPPLFVATGIAAVLLVAGDLAEQLRGWVSRAALPEIGKASWRERECPCK